MPYKDLNDSLLMKNGVALMDNVFVKQLPSAEKSPNCSFLLALVLSPFPLLTPYLEDLVEVWGKELIDVPHSTVLTGRY